MKLLLSVAMALFSTAPALAHPSMHELKPLTRPNPDYPLSARRACIEGVVKFSFQVDKHGIVKDVEITESPHCLLSATVVESVKQWRFAPMIELPEGALIGDSSFIKFGISEARCPR